jgi:hypothetical protein
MPLSTPNIGVTPPPPPPSTPTAGSTTPATPPPAAVATARKSRWRYYLAGLIALGAFSYYRSHQRDVLVEALNREWIGADETEIRALIHSANFTTKELEEIYTKVYRVRATVQFIRAVFF